MSSWQASAPGKVILFGEHAVVYGRPAIAVPVADIRAQAALRSAASGSGLRIVAADLNREYRLADAAAADPLATIINLTLQHLQQVTPPDAVLEVTSTIPLGRGLGSGAAISTAIVRVLADYFERQHSPGQVSNLVYEVEKLYHGTPSGIDNTVVAFEQPVYFVKERPIQRMRVGRHFTLVIGDTGVSASTRQVVGEVRHRWQVNRRRFEGYFDEIGAIARQARVIIERGLSGVPALGKLVNENQELLEKIGVSSPELRRLVEAARKAGAPGAKLSGAGGGGNMIALVASKEDATTVSEALWAAGAAGVIISQVT